MKYSLSPLIRALTERAGRLKECVLELPYFRHTVLAIALLFFVLGLVYSVVSRPQLLMELDPWYVGMILFAGVPLTIAMNAWEYRLMGLSLGKWVSWGKCMEVTVVGSAANMLPLPGAAMTRLAALSGEGITLNRSIGSIGAFAALWIAAALLYSGLFLASIHGMLFGWGCLGVGAAILGASIYGGVALGFPGRLMGEIIVQKLLQVVLESIRVYWALAAMEATVFFPDATIFVLAGVLGSAVSIVPAGLGIREGASALLAPLVGISAEAGFLSSGINRMASMAILGLITVILLLKKGKPQS